MVIAKRNDNYLSQINFKVKTFLVWDLKKKNEHGVYLKKKSLPMKFLLWN